MKGIIALWSGVLADIPFGWKLCDGNNGTPDLSDRFIFGASLTLDPHLTGGFATHLHYYRGPGHTHSLPAGSDIAAGTDVSQSSNSSVSEGNTNPTASMPPFYTLAFIMHI